MTASGRTTGSSLLITTLLTVLGAETAFFATLIMAFIYLRSSETSAPYFHPAPGQALLPIFNTILLLISGLIVGRALSAAPQNQPARLRSALSMTLALGGLFVIGQVIEFARSGMRPDDAAYGGVFFTLMGFHAVHVLAGMVFLGLNLLRVRSFGAQRTGAVTGGVWFWWYVIGVWLVLFTVLYLV